LSFADENTCVAYDQVSYHEVESFNGDNNSLYVEKAGTLLLESLLPGRNYSISVQAISNGMESNETSLYQATRKYTLPSQ
jgi:cadherin 5 type 2 (VE-cadherin)